MKADFSACKEKNDSPHSMYDCLANDAEIRDEKNYFSDCFSDRCIQLN